MAVTIVATVGSASANSYVTLAECTTYMEARLNSDAFDDAAEDSKNRALVEATRELTVLPWDGLPVTATQALAWPRQWSRDPDSPVQDYFETDVIPQRVKDAACELAFQFLKAGTTDVAAEPAEFGVIEKTVDVLTTRYEPRQRSTGLRRYPRVWDRVAPLLQYSPSTRRLVRG
jgi:hypothetical protein